MSGSWKICRVAGIPISIHWTFLILVAWIAMGSLVDGANVMEFVARLVFIAAIFACIVLHELGHALTARRYGVRTSEITLLPIGGVARLARMPDRPWQELLVALAGPAVTVAIVGVLWLAGVRPATALSDSRFLVGNHFWSNLLVFNAFLALFNLLPAFPMDGGRVLRSLLAMRLDYAVATRIAASIGQLMAIVFGVLGLGAGNPMLVLIAVFVWLGAEAEAGLAERRRLLVNVRVREAMLSDYDVLDTADSLEHAADQLLSGSQHDFPVASHGRIVGFLTRDDLIAGLARSGREARVGDCCRTDVGTVEAGALLEPAVDRMNQGEVSCLCVMEGEKRVGIVTPEHLRDFLIIRAAGHGASVPGRTPRRPARSENEVVSAGELAS